MIAFLTDLLIGVCWVVGGLLALIGLLVVVHVMPNLLYELRWRREWRKRKEVS